MTNFNNQALQGLNEGFDRKIRIALGEINDPNFKPVEGFVSFELQAARYCLVHPKSFVEQTIHLLEHEMKESFYFIASFLKNELKNPLEISSDISKKQLLPGMSFHNWGLSVKCEQINPETGNKIIKHTNYQKFKALCQKLGLNPGEELGSIQWGKDFYDSIIFRKNFYNNKFDKNEIDSNIFKNFKYFNGMNYKEVKYLLSFT